MDCLPVMDKQVPMTSLETIKQWWRTGIRPPEISQASSDRSTTLPFSLVSSDSRSQIMIWYTQANWLFVMRVSSPRRSNHGTRNRKQNAPSTISRHSSPTRLQRGTEPDAPRAAKQDMVAMQKPSVKTRTPRQNRRTSTASVTSVMPTQTTQKHSTQWQTG